MKRTHKLLMLADLNSSQQEKDGNFNMDLNSKRETLEMRKKEFLKITLDFVEMILFSYSYFQFFYFYSIVVDFRVFLISKRNVNLIK